MIIFHHSARELLLLAHCYVVASVFLDVARMFLGCYGPPCLHFRLTAVGMGTMAASNGQGPLKGPYSTTDR